jgi:hypothetical protein
MHVDDAAAFIVDSLQNPRRVDGYPTYGYDVWLPNVIVTYIAEVRRALSHVRAYIAAGEWMSYPPFSMTLPGVCAASGSSGRGSRMLVGQAPQTERALRAIALQPLATAGSSGVRQLFSLLIPTASAKCLTSSRTGSVPDFYNEQPRLYGVTDSAPISGVALCAEPPPSRSCWRSLSRKAEKRGPR